jgi:hypothetical protein
MRNSQGVYMENQLQVLQCDTWLPPLYTCEITNLVPKVLDLPTIYRSVTAAKWKMEDGLTRIMFFRFSCVRTDEQTSSEQTFSSVWRIWEDYLL